MSNSGMSNIQVKSVSVSKNSVKQMKWVIEDLTILYFFARHCPSSKNWTSPTKKYYIFWVGEGEREGEREDYGVSKDGWDDLD